MLPSPFRSGNWINSILLFGILSSLDFTCSLLSHVFSLSKFCQFWVAAKKPADTCSHTLQTVLVLRLCPLWGSLECSSKHGSYQNDMCVRKRKFTCQGTGKLALVWAVLTFGVYPQRLNGFSSAYFDQDEPVFYLKVDLLS